MLMRRKRLINGSKFKGMTWCDHSFLKGHVMTTERVSPDEVRSEVNNLLAMLVHSMEVIQDFLGNEESNQQKIQPGR